MVGAVASGAGLDRGRAERALLLAICMLCRRLTAQEAQHLIAQLPSRLQPRLEHCLDGPDRSVTAEAINNKLSRALGADSDGATAALQAVCGALADTVTKGSTKCADSCQK